MGPPGDTETQNRVVEAALELLEHAEEGGTIFELDSPYRPG
jgi:hypothetical protein